MATRVVTTVVGDGNSGGGDGTGTNARVGSLEGLTLTSDDAMLYVAGGSPAHTIRAVRIGDMAVTTVAGSHNNPSFADGVHTSARFHTPAGVVLSPDNLILYVSEAGGSSSHNRIRTIISWKPPSVPPPSPPPTSPPPPQ